MDRFGLCECGHRIGSHQDATESDRYYNGYHNGCARCGCERFVSTMTLIHRYRQNDRFDRMAVWAIWIGVALFCAIVYVLFD